MLEDDVIPVLSGKSSFVKLLAKHVDLQGAQEWFAERKLLEVHENQLKDLETQLGVLEAHAGHGKVDAKFGELACAIHSSAEIFGNAIPADFAQRICKLKMMWQDAMKELIAESLVADLKLELVQTPWEWRDDVQTLHAEWKNAITFTQQVTLYKTDKSFSALTSAAKLVPLLKPAYCEAGSKISECKEALLSAVEELESGFDEEETRVLRKTFGTCSNLLAAADFFIKLVKGEASPTILQPAFCNKLKEVPVANIESV